MTLALALADVATGLLALAGLIKFFDPQPWVLALRNLGLSLPGPLRRWSPLARLAGLGELAVAVAVFTTDGVVAWSALLLAYGLFTLVSVRARRRGGVSCGCFGVRSAPISGLHVAVNAGVVGVIGVVLAGDGAQPLIDRFDAGVPAAIAYLVFAGLGVAATVTVLTLGADLLDVRRSVIDRAATAAGPR